MNPVYFSSICPWAPGLNDDKELWKEWAAGTKQIEQTDEAPKLEYTSPLFRRRLSQITRMTVHVIHNLLEKTKASGETKIVFISLRGEIAREFSINKQLIEDNEILPAPFSLSVFNTPVSSATIAFHLTGGYSVLYPSKNNFASAVIPAVSPIRAGTEKTCLFVYADELVPECYGGKRPKDNTPLAFAALVSAEPSPDAVLLNNFENIPEEPKQFLKFLLKNGENK